MENGDSVKPSELKTNYEWKSVLSLYKSTIPDNVNAVEKRVHQLMYEDPRSIWLECGMGGVSHVEEALHGTALSLQRFWHHSQLSSLVVFVSFHFIVPQVATNQGPVTDLNDD